VAQASIAEARARQDEVAVAARADEAEATRTEMLKRQGLVSEAELERLRADAQGRSAAAEALARALERTESEHRMRESDQRASLATLERELARLAGLKAVSEQALLRLEHELELRRLRAPVAGRVGEVASLPPGTYVEEGTRLGAIVPAGGVRILTEFPASESVGRLRPGLPARLRLDAFPWTQFGSQRARVERVANEARDGRVRVELSVQPTPGSPVPLQHGLLGTVEAAVEETTPAMLVLRAAGASLRTRFGDAP
jgi:membrane fusion protein (multidrug efflux system)